MLQDDRACTPPLRVVLLTGGHGYQRDAYLSMFTGIAGLQLTHVEHGGSTASGWEHPSLAGCDAVLLYDLQQQLTEPDARGALADAGDVGRCRFHGSRLEARGAPRRGRAAPSSTTRA